MDPSLHEDPIACSLTGAEHGARRRRWEELCRSSLIELVRTRSGVRLRFNNNHSAASELARLVHLESDCCSFARWVLTRRGEELVLQVSGGPDAVGAVQALFAAPPPRPPAPTR